MVKRMTAKQMREEERLRAEKMLKLNIRSKYNKPYSSLEDIYADVKGHNNE